jgi:hypothetical protein
VEERHHSTTYWPRQSIFAAGKQGGPGNEPKLLKSVINVAQSQNATIVMGLSFLMTTQLLMKFALWPDRIGDHAPGTHGRFEFLLQEVLREIKNMPMHDGERGSDRQADRARPGQRDYCCRMPARA